jgi:hypothetical protein
LPTPQERELIYRARRNLEKEGQRSWATIYEQFQHIPPNQVRKIYFREKQKRGEHIVAPVPSVVVSGPTVEQPEFDEDEIWDLAVRKSRRRRTIEKKKNGRRIEFSHGPVCIVWLADTHLGSTGVHYDRLAEDIETIKTTPGMYVCVLGDILDNFIMGRLKDIRLGTEFSISEEWVLARRVLRELAPKLLLSVSGNHDLWTYALTGIDYLKEIHVLLNPGIAYAKYDASVTLAVGGREYIMRARHKWKGYSQYNDTHGIEWAAKFDKGRHFDIGIGAHIHKGALYRQFVNGGVTGHALMCGSYKTIDEHPMKLGFPEPNEAAAVAMIIDDFGESGTNNLDHAAAYMNAMYQD